MENLTLSFAQFFSDGIKVNSMAPALLKFSKSDSAEVRKILLSKQLLPREGGYNEIILAIDYILNSNYFKQ